MARLATMPPLRLVRSRRLVAVLALAFVIVGCARPVEPRWADAASSGEAQIYESPRETIVLEPVSDVGELQFEGILQAATSQAVLAEEDGRIVGNLLKTGDLVEQGQAVVQFRPAVSRATELEREVLELQRELSIEQGDEQTTADLDAAIDAFDAAVVASAANISTPVSGVVLGVPDGLTKAVAEGEELFTVATSNELVVVSETTLLRAEAVAVGDAVGIRMTTVGARELPAVVSAIDSTDDVGRVRLTFTPETDLDPSDLGEAIQIEVDLSVDSANDTLWIERRAVHRSEGTSFLLIEDDSGQLQRLDVGFGRRTETHVEVRQLGNDNRLAPGAVLVLP